MKKEYGNQYFEEHQKMISEFTELMKKLWVIVDDPKTRSKEKIKAISLIMQCYNNKFGLINLDPIVKEMKRYLDETKMKEKDIKRREKALQAYIEGRKLTEEEIDRAVRPDPIV